MTQRFVNNYSTIVAATFGAADTFLQVSSTAGLPTLAAGEYLLLTVFKKVGANESAHEVVKVTGIVANQLTVQRGFEGAAPSMFLTGDRVEARFTAAGAGNLVQREELAAHALDQQNPHGVTAAQVGADPAGTAAAAVTAHEGAADPHPQYTTEAEAAAAAPVQSVAGKTGAVTLAKGDVGLGNVDNTSDAAKPISTATQTALNAKQATLVSGTNIKTINSTSLLGTGNVAVQATLVSGTSIKTVNSTSLLGSGNLEIPSGGVPVKGLIYAGFNSATYVDSFGAKWLKTGVAVPSTPEIQTGLSSLGLTQLPFRTYLPSVYSGAFGGLSAYGNSKYVTINTTANTRSSAYSTDGTYWVTNNTLVYGTPVDLAFGGGKFVCLMLGTTNNVMYSANGINWTKTTIPGTSATWQAVTYGNDRFVAVAKNSNEAAYSLDGVTWTVTTLPRNAEWIDITWVSSGTFIALDRNSSKTSNSILAKSTDGVTWTPVNDSSTNTVASCLAPLNDYEVFFFQENSPYIGYYYINNPNCSSEQFNMGKLRTVASVCFGNNIFFAPLKDSDEYLTITATYSPTVTARKLSGTHFSGPCYGPSGFVMGSPTVGEVLHSPDAVTTQNVLFGVPDSTSGLSSYVRYA